MQQKRRVFRSHAFHLFSLSRNDQVWPRPVVPWMQRFVSRFIAHPELPPVPFLPRARNHSCSYGQDISSTQRRRSMRGDLPHLPHT